MIYSYFRRFQKDILKLLRGQQRQLTVSEASNISSFLKTDGRDTGTDKEMNPAKKPATFAESIFNNQLDSYSFVSKYRSVKHVVPT